MDYPKSLPDFKLVKQLNVKTGFNHNDPFDAYKVEHVTRDEVAEWNVSVMCSKQQTNDFEGFLITNMQKPFNKTILTPTGLHEYTVIITRQPLQPSQISRDIFQYSFDIMAQRLTNDYECIDRELYARYSLEFNSLDIMMNVNWPEYVE